MPRRNNLEAKDVTQANQLMKEEWEEYFENIFNTEDEGREETLWNEEQDNK